MIPDPEAVLTAYLEDYAAEVGATVVDQTPDDTTDPWVRLTLLDAPADGIVDHLVPAFVQLDCYAGTTGEDGHEQASLLARTIRAALVTIAAGVHEGAVVTGARIDGFRRDPDDTVDEPARERFQISATVWMHAAA